jgi:ParB-like chromosome segregation protein Spo0J
MTAKTDRRKERPRLRKVSVWRINILPQMRKTFNQQEHQELVESIGKKGVLSPPIVALFTRSELDEYLKVINLLRNRRLTNQYLKRSIIRGQERWYVLLGGERRSRAYKHHVQLGNKNRMLDVSVREHISVEDAIDIQMTENSHRRVPLHEEAEVFAEYWLYRKKRDAKLTIAEFGRRVARSPSTVKNALRFVKLPAVVRNAVAGEWEDGIPGAQALTKERRKLPYGIALALARLAEAGFSEEQLTDEMLHAVIRNTKVADFDLQVSMLIAQQGQNLLDLMTAVSSQEAKRTFRKRSIEAQLSRLLALEEVWFAKVLDLYERGLLGKADSPFGDASVRARMVRLGELYMYVARHLHKRASPAAKERIKHVRAVTEAFGQLQLTGT